jgi:glycosyltransferase involved in cell wall biosynthesis
MATERGEQTLKPKIVISGVNLIDFGPLAVFRDSLQALHSQFSSDYEIVALVHTQELLNVTGVTYIEFPMVKGSWMSRLRFEYLQCKRLSRELKPALWVAMHDITPRVDCLRQVVYCHNPSPFYRFSLKESWMDPKFGMFTLFYRFLYGIGIQKNEAVIVQQEWIRKEFEQRYGCKRVIVANAAVEPNALGTSDRASDDNDTYLFFYPAFPRTFKNHSLLLEAVDLLEQRGIKGFQLALTMNADSNRYGKSLFHKYQHLTSVRWLGSISRERVYEIYADADCLVFPSKLETWGLPITEFKMTGKPILAADLPYARETIGTYNKVVFFDARQAQKLSLLMEAALQRTLQWESQSAIPNRKPFAADWVTLWKLLLDPPSQDQSAPVREIAK